MNLLMLCQIVVCIFGLISIWAFVTKRNLVGCWSTLLGEPAWIYVFIVEKQYGMLLVAIWYVAMSIYGILERKKDAM